MKYLNAAEVLPKDLLIEIQKHIKGEVLYIPNDDERIRWGEKMVLGVILKIEIKKLSSYIKMAVV